MIFADFLIVLEHSRRIENQDNARKWLFVILARSKFDKYLYMDINSKLATFVFSIVLPIFFNGCHDCHGNLNKQKIGQSATICGFLI